MQEIQCPVCGRLGVLQWKTTVTIKPSGKRYEYRKLYVYHHKPKPKWCYLRQNHIKELEAKGITKPTNTQTLTQTHRSPRTNSEDSNFKRFIRNASEFKWTGRDLNPRPPECKSGVHTRLNYRPFNVSVHVNCKA